VPIEENIKIRIINLIERSKNLKVGDDTYHQALSNDQLQECSGWIASALNVVQLVCPNPENAYRKRAERIASKKSGWDNNLHVGEFSFLLIELQRDIENDLLASIADRARAETFDNFLDHAKEYLKENLKNLIFFRRPRTIDIPHNISVISSCGMEFQRSISKQESKAL